RRGLKGRTARKKPYLTAVHMQKRIKRAYAHRDWTIEDWKHVLWSDESSIQLWSNSRVSVRRRDGESLRADCMVPTVKGGGGRICFWAAFSAFGVSPLRIIRGRMTSDMYTDILENSLVPFIHELPMPEVETDSGTIETTARKRKGQEEDKKTF